MAETGWMRVPGYEAYDASRSGIVRSYWRSGGHGKPRSISDIPVECAGAITLGVKRHSLTDTKHRRRTLACASVILRTFRGLKRGCVPGYLDGNKLNCNLENLTWITPAVAAVVVVSEETAATVLLNHKNGKRFCGRCKTWQQQQNFPAAKFRCKSCHNDVSRLMRYEIQESDLLRTKTGKCEICKTPAISSRRPLVIDHCHKTGVFRGILCNNCNTAIGMLGDSPEVIDNALKYIRGFYEKN